MQSPQETLQGTPTTLPTTEPSAGNEQVKYTVASGDLPTFSISVKSNIWIALVYAAGKAVTAATISWRMKKNGTSLASSSISVGANTYYTLNCFFNTFVVGDVLTVSLWSNKTDSNWDYNAYQVQPSRITPDETNIVFLSFGSPGSFPTLASGNSHADYSGASVFYINGTLNASITSATTINLVQLSTYGLFQTYEGDDVVVNNATGTTSATYRPYYIFNTFPTSITFRYLRL